MKSFFKIFCASTLGFLIATTLPLWLKAQQQKGQENLSQVLFPIAEAGFGVNSEDLFENYTTWTNSTNLNASDTVVQTLFNLYASGNASSILDINGDGLSDVIIHSAGSTRKYAILINNGNIGFNLAYKCVKTSTTWYGNCAG